MTALLEVESLSIRFGGIAALDSVSFTVAPGEMVGLIGPNGAGKTTALNCISRYYEPTAGSLRFGGTDLRRHRSDQLISLGITRTFQHLEVFGWMTSLDNLVVAQQSQVRPGFLASMLRTRTMLRKDREMKARARDVLRMFELSEYEEWPAAALSYGVRKRLDLARAVISRPKLLLLDEPAAGITPGEMDKLAQLLNQVRHDDGTAVLLVEHHMPLVMKLCQRLVVLDFGKCIAQGTPNEIKANKQVLDAYLGQAVPAAVPPANEGAEAKVVT